MPLTPELIEQSRRRLDYIRHELEMLEQSLGDHDGSEFDAFEKLAAMMALLRMKFPPPDK